MKYCLGRTIPSRSLACIWSKKTWIVLSGLCVVAVIRVLMNTFVYPRDSSSIQPLHSKTSFKTMARDSVFSRPDESYVTPKINKIIILSYMRSGSTLAGDILQSHPDVFYVYEPLLYLWDYYVPNKINATLNLRKRTKSYWKSSNAYIAPPMDFLTYMFNCNLTAANLQLLTNAAHSRHFQSVHCPIYRNGMHVVNTSDYCVDSLTKRCMDANAVLVKVVRLSMAEADRYLQRHSDVKVIHLVRDPRGILLSRMNFNDKETGEMHNNYSNVCKRILDDVQMAQTVSHKHRGKILTLRYEDFAQNLKGFTRKLFNFLDLSMEPEVLQHLEDITSSQDILPNKKIKAKKTRRKNPYKTAYHWRQSLPFALVQKIDKACQELYKVLGYRPFITEADLRNPHISARSRYYGDGLVTAIL